MNRTNPNNNYRHPGLLHAIEAAILFGTLGGLTDAATVVSHQKNLASHCIPALHFFNASAILTSLAMIPCMIIVMLAIRLVSKWRKWDLTISLAALYFVAALPAGALVTWNIAGAFASNPDSEIIFTFLKYVWLVIPISWAFGVWLARIRTGLDPVALIGRLSGFVIAFSMYLVLVPMFQVRFLTESGSSLTENIIIATVVFIVSAVAFPIAAWISTLIARPRMGLYLAVIWIAALAIPFFPTLVSGPTTIGSQPSGADFIGRDANVVLVSIDTLRKDDLGIYGSDIVETPAIDKLAESSLVFDNAVTSMPMTGPAHISMLTGLQPECGIGHGIQNNGILVPDEIPTLATVLDESGYRTGAIIGGSPLSREASGLQKGFHYYNDIFEDNLKSRLFPSHTWSLTVSRIVRKLLSMGGIKSAWLKKPADRVTDQALRWLEDDPDTPFFLFLHYYDPHTPLEPPAPFDEMYSAEVTAQVSKFRENHPISSGWAGESPIHSDEDLALRRAIYRGEISFTDRELGRIFDHLRNAGLWENTLIIVTADHGEVFDPYYVGHINRLYESSVNVPLIIRNPDIVEESDSEVRIDNLVNISDIFFTILDFLDVDSPVDAIDLHSGIPGTLPDWNHILTDSKEDSGDYGWFYVPMFTYGIPTPNEVDVGRTFAFRFSDFKLIYAPQENDLLPEYQYFNLSDDPNEEIDIFGRTDPSEMPLPGAPDLLSAWSMIQQTADTSAMDPRIRAQLEALGYIGH